mgnify:CR=1 FL=1|jgi:hypothetical protein
MRKQIIDFLIKKGALHPGKSNWIVSWEDGKKLDIVDLIEEFTSSHSMIGTHFDYEINILYNTSETENVKITTHDIDKWISDYARNRDPFTYEIISKTPTE